MLAVTFTNKAAREMLIRISAMLPINTRGMWVGTFHGLCNRILRAHYRDAGLPQTFQILDSADQLAVVKRVMKAMNVDDEKYPPRQAQYFINGNKEQGLRAAQGRGLRRFFAPAGNGLRSLRRAVQSRRRGGFRRTAAALLRAAVEATSCCASITAAASSTSSWTSSRTPTACSITGSSCWRVRTTPFSRSATTISRSMRFAARAPATCSISSSDFHVEKVIKLEQNYRSQGNILDAANALIRHNRTRLGKNLWTAEGSGEPLRLYEAMTDLEEGGLHRRRGARSEQRGRALSDIALLYRSNAQSRVLEHALFNAGIAYRVYGGLRFFERQEIKHALAYLRLVANPDDDGAFLRVVNFPTRGIGNRSIEQLQEVVRRARHLAVAGGLREYAERQGRHQHRRVRQTDRVHAQDGQKLCRCRRSSTM